MREALAITEQKNTFSHYILFGLFALVMLAGQCFLVRSDFWYILSWQVLLHAIFYFFYLQRAKISVQQLLVAGALLRIVVAFTVPTLSDDIYRFIWEGRLIVQGQNPLLSTPDGYLAALPFSSPHHFFYSNLHALINHPQYYTCYPPLMQAVFAIAAFVGGKSIYLNMVVLKLTLALADVAAIYLFIKILPKLRQHSNAVVLYALNPLVIIEGTGNAHFEVMQVALMLTAVYYILQKKMLIAAVFWGLAIVTKLLPLLLLPLLVRYLGWRRGLLFASIACGVALISFIPFVSVGFITGFGKSINLYFQNFEFNASLYYVARAVGWQIVGYNYISVIGPLLMVIFLVAYAVLFFRRRSIITHQFFLYALLVFSLYYFLATTVHPWYIINLLPFALLANKKYAFVWMGTAFLSYCAYSNAGFAENVSLITIEYLVVAVAIYLNFRKKEAL